MKEIKITVWNEYISEKDIPESKNIYPKGMHRVIADFLIKEGFIVRTATLEEPEHGLTEKVLADTDVLIWWGHRAHDKVNDFIVERIYKRVLEGMGLIVLHSGHMSKIFRRLMGTSCRLKWREDGKMERIWIVAPWHPIAEGLGDYFEIEHTEMYGEPFDIPPPDELVFISWFEGGEVFRSGCCFYRGMGKIFYFRPGHETYPIYYDKNVQRVIINAVKWVKPVKRPKPILGHFKQIK